MTKVCMSAKKDKCVLLTINHRKKTDKNNKKNVLSFYLKIQLLLKCVRLLRHTD